jgi:hypothetical protein
VTKNLREQFKRGDIYFLMVSEGSFCVCLAHVLGQNVMVAGVYDGEVLQLKIRKQRARNLLVPGITFKDIPPVTYFLQLGSTSLSFQNVPK